MKLVIDVKGGKKISLILKEKKEIVDLADFVFNRNLDTLLVWSVDKFLKKNKIDGLSLTSIEVRGDVDKNSSLYRILGVFKSTVEGQKAHKKRGK
jgi:hypothetical protein